ncbi:MAG: LamG domain-containing protein, partial [bacterium]
MYNHLNLPEQVTKSNGDYVKYIYDATGRKLRQEVYLAGQPDPKKKSEYAGEYMYENDTLKFINHEEGRVVAVVPSGPPTTNWQYPLNGNMQDAGINGLNGTLQGGYTLATDRNNNQAAVQFNGTDGYGQIPNNLDLDFKDKDFTVSFWVKKLQSTVNWFNCAGVGKWNNGGAPGTNSWSLSLCSDANNNVPGLVVEIGNTYYQVNASTSLVIGQWYQLSASKQGNIIRIFVNGTLEGTTQIPGTNLTLNSQTMPVYVGRLASGYNTNAVFDDIQITKNTGAGGPGSEYQYHLKDHLGNTRLTFTTKEETEMSNATYEEASLVAEQGKYLRMKNARRVNSSIFDHTNGDAPTKVLGYAQRLNGSTNETFGLARSLSVMPGDVVGAEVFAKYVDPATVNSTTPTGQSLLALLSQISAGAVGVVVDGALLGSSTASFPANYNSFLGSKTTNTAPKAYLNWLVFDTDFKFLTGGYDPLTTVAGEDGTD